MYGTCQGCTQGKQPRIFAMRAEQAAEEAEQPQGTDRMPAIGVIPPYKVEQYRQLINMGFKEEDARMAVLETLDNPIINTALARATAIAEERARLESIEEAEKFEAEQAIEAAAKLEMEHEESYQAQLKKLREEEGSELSKTTSTDSTASNASELFVPESSEEEDNDEELKRIFGDPGGTSDLPFAEDIGESTDIEGEAVKADAGAEFPQGMVEAGMNKVDVPPKLEWLTSDGPQKLTSTEVKELTRLTRERLGKEPAPAPTSQETSVESTSLTPEQQRLIKYIKGHEILQGYLIDEKGGRGEIPVNTFRGFLQFADLDQYRDYPLMDTLTLQDLVVMKSLSEAFVKSPGIMKEFHVKRFIRLSKRLKDDPNSTIGLRIETKERTLGNLTLAEKLLIEEYIKNDEDVDREMRKSLVDTLLPDDDIDTVLGKKENYITTYHGKLLIAQLLNIKAKRSQKLDSESLFSEALDLLMSDDTADIDTYKKYDILWRIQENLARLKIVLKKYDEVDGILRDMTCAGASDIPECEERKRVVKTIKDESKLRDNKKVAEDKFGHIAEDLTLDVLVYNLDEAKQRITNPIDFVKFIFDYLPDNLKTDPKIGSNMLLNKLEDPNSNLSFSSFVKRARVLFSSDKHRHEPKDSEKGDIIIRYLDELNEPPNPQDDYEGLEQEIEGQKKDLEIFIKEKCRTVQSITDKEVNPKWDFTSIEEIRGYVEEFKHNKQIELQGLTYKDMKLKQFMGIAIDSAVDQLIADYLAEPRKGIFKEGSSGGGKKIRPKRTKRKTQKRTNKRKTSKKKKKTKKKKKRSTKRKRR